METGGPSHDNDPDIELYYNTKITFIRQNTYGAFIYKDPSNRFLIKIHQDHPTNLRTRHLWITRGITTWDHVDRFGEGTTRGGKVPPKVLQAHFHSL